MNALHRFVCWFVGHDWHTDLTLFASDRECALRCHRCGRRDVLTSPWRRT